MRKIGPETAKISRNVHPNKARDPRVLVELIVTAAQIYQRTLSHRDWASEPQSTGDASLAHTYTVCLRLYYSALYKYTQYSALRTV